jgi:hypothetical protein
METKEHSVNYAGHQIRVAAKSEGARLSIDDELIGVTNDLYANEDEATLVAVFGEDDKFRIEVFVKPATLEAAVRVNDHWVVGGLQLFDGVYPQRLLISTPAFGTSCSDSQSLRESFVLNIKAAEE